MFLFHKFSIVLPTIFNQIVIYKIYTVHCIIYYIIQPGCDASEATGLEFVCFVAINPRVMSTNRVDLGFSVS